MSFNAFDYVHKHETCKKLRSEVKRLSDELKSAITSAVNTDESNIRDHPVQYEGKDYIVSISLKDGLSAMSQDEKLEVLSSLLSNPEQLPPPAEVLTALKSKVETDPVLKVAVKQSKKKMSPEDVALPKQE
jgi:hypothetical protein